MVDVFKPHDIVGDGQAQLVDENFDAAFEAISAVTTYISVTNNDTVPLPAGTPVYISGGNGTGAVVKRAQADASATADVLGLMTARIEVDGTGWVADSGILAGIDTTGFDAGDTIYLGAAVAGTLVGTEPTAPDLSVPLGTVILGGQANGSIIIKAVAASNHTLLSATHTDSTAGTVARGDFITGQGASATWTRLALGTSGKVPRSDGTDLAYSTFTIPDTFVQGDVLYASSANTLASLAKSASAKRYIGNQGASNSPAWEQVDLALGVSGTLPVANGGTGITNYVAAGRLITSTSATTLGAIASGLTRAVPLSQGGSSAVIWSSFVFPSTFAVNTIVYASSTDTLAALATANSGVLVTSGAGVPSIATDIPTAVTIGTAYIYRAAGTDVALADGGMNASLTANVGGIFYSTATAGAILAGTATAGQIVRSGASAAPTWSTATYPATVTVDRLLYASAANVISDLATANSGVLITSGAGVPSISSTLPTAVQDTITRLGTVVSGVWNGTALVGTYGGTGITTFGAAQRVPYAASTTALTTSANFVYDGIALYAYHAQGYAASYGYGSGEWQRYSSSSFDTAPSFIGARGRGTRAVPLGVVDGDLLFSINVWGYSGAAATLRKAAEIDVAVDGEPDTAGDTTDMPGRFVFLLSADGTSSVSEVMRINNRGNLFIGNAEAYPTAGSKGLIFGDGTALSGMGLNTAALFANDDGGTVKMYAIDEAGSVALLNYRNIALGAGAAPTLGTIGGSGPTVAEQDSWLEFNIGGTAYWVPAWV